MIQWIKKDFFENLDFFPKIKFHDNTVENYSNDSCMCISIEKVFLKKMLSENIIHKKTSFKNLLLAYRN